MCTHQAPLAASNSPRPLLSYLHKGPRYIHATRETRTRVDSDRPGFLFDSHLPVAQPRLYLTMGREHLTNDEVHMHPTSEKRPADCPYSFSLS